MTGISEHGTSRRRTIAVIGALIVVAALGAWWWMSRGQASDDAQATESTEPPKEANTNEVTIPAEVYSGAGIQTEAVISAPAVDRLQLTGQIEANQEQIQEVTPLVSGRVERVNVNLGDRVSPGTSLLTIASPQIAEVLGNLRSAEAALAEAEATLTRTRKLIELGAGAGKDLIAAEAAQRTAAAQVTQHRESLRALGATEPPDGADGAASAMAVIRSSVAGTIVDRQVNSGAWIETGKSVLTIVNLSTVWVIASVPEARLGLVRLGAPAEIHVRAPGGTSLVGRVSYIDPQLDQETRSARVRVQVANRDETLKIGMFTDVTIEAPVSGGKSELRIPSSAVQRLGERTVVFVPTGKERTFEVRDVSLGEETEDSQVILEGLKVGERVVTSGGFVLKSQMLKGQFGEDEEL